MKKNLEVIKQITTSPCYCCNRSIKGKTIAKKNCKACNGTGFYIENHYLHIVTDKKGNKYCFDGDTVK
jgi:DnaJ-class molecular chaperone